VPDNTDIAIVLNWYEKEGMNLIDEEPILNLTVDDVLNLFEAPFWNKLYHCWAVKKNHIPALQANVNHQIDFSRYSYFVEIYKLTRQVINNKP